MSTGDATAVTASVAGPRGVSEAMDAIERSDLQMHAAHLHPPPTSAFFSAATSRNGNEQLIPEHFERALKGFSRSFPLTRFWLANLKPVEA